jgi:hypothetical protein
VIPCSFSLFPTLGVFGPHTRQCFCSRAAPGARIRKKWLLTKFLQEEITGIDIVAAQIQIAAGATLEQLGLTQDRISTRGFAIQTRITTEDPSKNFQPDTGKIEVYRNFRLPSIPHP